MIKYYNPYWGQFYIIDNNCYDDEYSDDVFNDIIISNDFVNIIYLGPEKEF